MAAVLKPHNGQFKPGNPGGGRPVGSRNKLGEIALAALRDDFAVHGAAAIEKVRREKTHIYLQIIAGLLPRQLQVERTSVLGELSDEELTMLEEMLAAGRAKLVEQHKGAAAALESADTKHPDKP